MKLFYLIITLFSSRVISIPAGLWTLTVGGSRQFYVVNTTLNWTDAQAYCRANYTDLATIKSDEEMNTVKAMLDGSSDDFWIGMRQINSNLVVGAGGTEIQIVHRLLCSQKMDSRFKSPLIVIKEEKTWREALRFCRQNHVDLVSVQSEEMQDWVGVVTQNAFTNVTSRVWIGLRHTSALGFWYWVTGETICYQNWAPGNNTGVEDCGDGERTGAMLSDSKKWISLPETQTLPFICVIF